MFLFRNACSSGGVSWMLEYKCRRLWMCEYVSVGISASGRVRWCVCVFVCVHTDNRTPGGINGKGQRIPSENIRLG